MNPHDIARMTMALTRDEGPVAALDTMMEATLVMATGRIPDVGRAREALAAWGILFEDGEPISRMFSSTPALAAQLPVGWNISRRGGGGHHELLDDRGASRIRWHLHGWDPISLSINARFNIHRSEDISAIEAVVPVYDGPTVIHTIPIRYPHARINKPLDDGSPYYRNGYAGEDTGWTKEMSGANYKVEEAAHKAAYAWLDENKPKWRDSLASWETP